MSAHVHSPPYAPEQYPPDEHVHVHDHENVRVRDHASVRVRDHASVRVHGAPLPEEGGLLRRSTCLLRGTSSPESHLRGSGHGDGGRGDGGHGHVHGHHGNGYEQ